MKFVHWCPRLGGGAEITRLSEPPRRKRQVASQLPGSSFIALNLGMAQHTQDELKVIRAYPIGTGLDTFRTTLKSRFRKKENEDSIEIVDWSTSGASDRGADRRS